MATPFEDSETIALRALGFLVSEGARLGVNPFVLRTQPIGRQDLARALDALIGHEGALQAFAARIHQPPEAAYEARRRLGVGAVKSTRG